MLRFLTFIMVISLVFAFLACTAEKKEEAAQTETAVEETAVADSTVCAGGCEMKMETAKMVAHEQDGETLYFCSDKCKAEYLAKDKAEEAAEEVTKEES